MNAAGLLGGVSRHSGTSGRQEKGDHRQKAAQQIGPSNDWGNRLMLLTRDAPDHPEGPAGASVCAGLVEDFNICDAMYSLHKKH